MEAFAEKALRYYGEVSVHKELVQQAGLGSRSIPAFVSEWIVSRYVTEQQVTDEAQQQIQEFINRHLPPKDQREQIKERLLRGEPLLLLDQFSASVDLARGELRLRIPLLDDNKATIADHLVERYPLLLGSGLWGVGKLSYIPGLSPGKGIVEMTDFRPMQAAAIDVDLYCEPRKQFALAEWRDLLVSSMGYNPAAYSPNEQMLLITRLIPLVQERVNLMELAPKGTGKSYVYLNLSRYVRLVSGGRVTAAVLFYNNATNQPGLLTQFDAVVFDEAQSLSFDNPSEVIGVLKDYLESGQFSRGGKQKVEATAGMIILANIALDAEGKPRHRHNYFLNLPSFLGETAFIDRIHGILPGWELPRIRESAISRTIGFKADFLGEVLHALRHRAGYEALAERYSRIVGTEDRRDRTAILRLASGYLKLLFPHQEVSQSDFDEYCLRPAIRLRQQVRDQLAWLDPEYKPVTISIGGGDA